MAMFRTLISAAVLLATVICLGTAHEELLQSLDDVESLEESSPLSRINLNKVWDNEQNEAALDNGDDTFLLEERGTGEAPAAPKEAAPTEKAAPAAPKKAAPAAPKKAAPASPKKAAPAAPKKAAPAAPKKAAPAAPKKAAPASPTKAAPVAPTKAAPVAPTKAAAAASPTKAAPVAPTKAAPVAPTKAAPAGAAPEAAKPAPTADAPKGETPTAEGKGNAPAAGGDTALPGLVKNLVKLKTDVDKIQGSNWMKILEDHRDGVVQIMVVKKKFLWKAAYRSPLSVEVSGSGWFIDNSEFSVDTKNQMLVVTNAHVAKNAAEINILIPSLGQEPVPVEVVGLCSQRDIAILRVENPAKLLSMYKAKTGKDSITKMKLGDSDKMKRGANCMAVGYPLGLKSVKASMGIVSGYQQFHSALYLQITAPINPGNSGGPLFNDEGQVVGINSAKIAQASGMSFSIASVQLKVMLDVLYERREFVVPFLGYKFSVGTKLLHKYLHVQGDTLQQGGIYITNVQPQGLFVKAGVKRGDLLVTVDGANIDRFGQAWMPTMKDNINILGLLARKKVGTFLVLGVWRAKEKKMLSLSVQYDSTDPFAIPYIYEPILNIPKFEIFAGVVLMELSLNMVSVLLPQNVAGLIKYTLPENRMKPRIVIAGVIPGSLAALDGSIKAGLLVDTINSKEVSAMADVCTVLSQKPKEWWTISTRETFTAFKVEQVDLFEKEDAPNKHAACAKQAKPTPATGSQFESDLNMLL